MRTTDIPSSTLAVQQAYVQSLAERAEGIAMSTKIVKVLDEVQRPSSAPAKYGCGMHSGEAEGKPCHANALASPEHFHQSHGFQNVRNSQQANQEDIVWNKYGYNEAYEYCDEATTVMLCNIPCRVKLEEIIQAVASLGFDGTYDLLHAPGPKRRHPHLTSTTNIGYAFINFVTPEYADQFMKVFTGFCFEGRHSEKVGLAKLARIQGFHNNYTLIKSSLAQCILPMGLPRKAILQ
jgi:hypothetical protein